MRRADLLGPPIAASEITPEELYLGRRKLLRASAATAASLAVGALGHGTASAAPEASWSFPNLKRGRFTTDEALTPEKDVTSYNNFYEFGTDKSAPSENAHTLRTRPWAVACDGEIAKPRSIDVDALLKIEPIEERVYRLRCVEAWSMVIPWVGVPLGPIIKRLEPTSRAKFVAFTTLHAPDQMPGQRRTVLDWPYVEGLRMDEALHPLAILAVGLYGRVLPNQNGAPVRLVVPWKYGFKSIKSIVRIRFVEQQPPTSWNLASPREYGFYSNVNPDVDHPRWSQARERRIGEFWKRKTLPFNGYGAQVAQLYAGMDLRVNH